jgi:hypothetical protein
MGYETGQAAALYPRHVAPFAPDAVLIPAYADRFLGREPLLPAPLPDPPGADVDVRAVLEHLFVFHALRAEARDLLEDHLALDWGKRARRARGAQPASVATRDRLLEFVRARRAEGVTVHLVLQPRARDFRPAAHRLFRAQVEGWAAAAPGLSILDVAGHLGTAIGYRNRLYAGDQHPDARFHALVGHALGELLLPRLPSAQGAAAPSSGRGGRPAQGEALGHEARVRVGEREGERDVDVGEEDEEVAVGGPREVGLDEARR